MARTKESGDGLTKLAKRCVHVGCSAIFDAAWDIFRPRTIASDFSCNIPCHPLVFWRKWRYLLLVILEFNVLFDDAMYAFKDKRS